MIQEQIKQAIQFIKENTDADDFMLRGDYDNTLETRFAQNRITQNISGEKYAISATLIYGKKRGNVSIEQFDNEYILKRLKLAKTIAINSVDDPEIMPTLPQAEYTEYVNYDKKLADIDVEGTVKIVKRCIENALQKEAVVSGMLTREDSYTITSTKNGFEGEEKTTFFEHSMTIKKDSRETRVTTAVLREDLYDLEALITKLNRQFDSISEAQEMLARKINVILRPQAVIDLFSFMSWFMDRRDADNGMTPFSGQLDKPFFGENFNMVSSFADDRIVRPAFSFEGIVNKEIDWIKNGVLNNLATSRFYAEDKGIPQVNRPFNLIIEGGDNSEEDMMKMVDEGLIINRFWYLRVIDKKSGELTGLTRDGVLYFKDGKVQKSVNNFRWNEIPHDVARRILALGKAEINGGWAIIPTMLIKDFTFVDNTRF